MAIRAAIRDPQRWLLFALAALIHAGLFQLLISERQLSREAPERRTVLVFVPDTAKSSSRPEVAPLAPERLTNAPLPESTAPQLLAPPTEDETRTPPVVDWQREAEDAARKHVLAAEAARKTDGSSGPAKPKPEFHWSHSQIHRIEPLESGGFIVWISENCFIVIGALPMPMCKLGKKPARGDLFEHMNDPPTPGDWKDD